MLVRAEEQLWMFSVVVELSSVELMMMMMILWIS